MVHQLLNVVLLSLQSTGHMCKAFSGCSTRAQLPHWLGGSSRTRFRACVPCIGRWIAIHSATREVLLYFSTKANLSIFLGLSCYKNKGRKGKKRENLSYMLFVVFQIYMWSPSSETPEYLLVFYVSFAPLT